ncbi:ABC transporter ATP-binding protein [Loigolactobacillus coryniformis]|jgi:osmoprotectant transport system ATP-binding protein|uniref:Quaternary amine transport ATP-binding protein n=2 Tax=Loigolactobacillus coryniformis subsp. coryniformis TaxID=115541 RepID=J3EPV5_9LACO|nr:ABC transporter ATP-binding protein [Loigolactobacillus coryniformis]OEH89983.1 glycine/betaine ABC transporter ATP-binding protein [Loigolactobacillus coryniformis subsp. coryniformis]ATO54491.1 glycine/betaine ABC transporter ATP-binding protein [Loigolactobacillus coryniformis subsp. coryniformis KCTC 3167 = DSM 20001]EJN55235.1 Glycine betaine/carnitine/choline ABC transporter, ATP-binding protein [Loigolactobacillus coryniformis subsp. coryniformis CECT 5711]KRK15927.1 ABC-type proline 
MVLLKMSHLNKIYGGTKAVDDFNLEIEKGEFICFIGTSGSGKTTTMRMINRMLHQTSGTIEINGEDISKMDPVKLRRKIGYVIQNIGLMPHMTIRDNITLVPRLLKWSEEKRNEKAKEMIKLVELPEDYLDRYPAELSGGQQQRIGVVRALAADQDIILMDEPFGALDPITRESLQDLVKDLQERLGKTFIFVTHDMDEALTLATRIVIMSHGKQVQVDTPDNILRHPANEFVESLIGQERLIQARPSITTVGQVATKAVSARESQTLKEALGEMHTKRVDTLLVTDDAGVLRGFVGIEQINQFYGTGKKIGDIMDKNIFYVKEDSVIRDTVERILKRGFKNVPVIDHDHHLVGIVTRATLVDMVYDALWGESDKPEKSDDTEVGDQA